MEKEAREEREKGRYKSLIYMTVALGWSAHAERAWGCTGRGGMGG